MKNIKLNVEALDLRIVPSTMQESSLIGTSEIDASLSITLETSTSGVYIDPSEDAQILVEDVWNSSDNLCDATADIVSENNEEIDLAENNDCEENGLAPVPPPTLQEYADQLKSYLNLRDKVLEDAEKVQTRVLALSNSKQNYEDLAMRLSAEKSKPNAQQNALLIGQLEVDLEDASITLTEMYDKLGTTYASYSYTYQTASETKTLTENMRSVLNANGQSLAVLANLPQKIADTTIFDN